MFVWVVLGFHPTRIGGGVVYRDLLCTMVWSENLLFFAGAVDRITSVAGTVNWRETPPVHLFLFGFAGVSKRCWLGW